MGIGKVTTLDGKIIEGKFEDDMKMDWKKKNN